MSAAAATISRALASPSAVFARVAASDAASAAAWVVAALTAASISAAVGVADFGCAAASRRTVAIEVWRLTIWRCLTPAGAAIVAAARVTVAAPERVVETPCATAPQLRTEVWYAAVRVACTPLRAVARPANTEVRTPASAASVFSARLSAASLLRAAASAAFGVLAGAALVAGAVVVGVAEGTAEDVAATAVAGG